MKQVPCPVCSGPVDMKPAIRKSGKPSVTLVCRSDAGHFRGFINDPGFINSAIESARRVVSR